MSLFEKGREKTGGRSSGTRNKFSKKFDEALLKDFEEHGEAQSRSPASSVPPSI